MSLSNTRNKKNEILCPTDSEPPLIAKMLEEQLKNKKLERKITVDVEIEEAIKGIVL